MQDRHDRRLILKRDVGMPLVCNTTVGGRQLKYIRMISKRIFQVRMVFKLAKIMPKLDMLLWAHGLPGKKQYFVFQQ